MRIQNSSKSIVCCFMACVAGTLFLLMSHQVEAQVTYTVTGGFEGGSPLEPTTESFLAVFEIDDSVVDSDPNDEGRGVYSGAIVSSSFSFSDGFTSMVDFSGGTVTVLPDNDGGGIIIQSPDNSGQMVIYSSATLASDALLTSGQEIGGDRPFSLWILTEPDGGQRSNFSSVTLLEPMALSVSAATILGDVDLSGAVDFLDIAPFVSVLVSGSYQAEADTNEDGTVDLLDIDKFISYLTSSS